MKTKIHLICAGIVIMVFTCTHYITSRFLAEDGHYLYIIGTTFPLLLVMTLFITLLKEPEVGAICSFFYPLSVFGGQIFGTTDRYSDHYDGWIKCYLIYFTLSICLFCLIWIYRKWKQQ